jgi:hypothetical protein
VGYGDIDFHADGTKMFLCCYILGSIALLMLSFHNSYCWFETTKTLAQRSKQLTAQSDLRFLAASSSAQGINKFEVTLAILARTGKLSLERDIAPLLKASYVRIHHVVCSAANAFIFPLQTFNTVGAANCSGMDEQVPAALSF